MIHMSSFPVGAFSSLKRKLCSMYLPISVSYIYLFTYWPVKYECGIVLFEISSE